MIWRRHSLATVVALCSAVLLVSACGTSTDTGGNTATPSGDPVSGGTANMIQVREPVTLEPGALSNNWTGQGLLGNALYGTLMTDDVETLEIEYKLATDFSTLDGGATFTLQLRPDLVFSDGTPLNAEAVKFNWDRLRAPSTASTSLPQASQIAATEVTDETTLSIMMVRPNPMFAHSITSSALNWIASPTALQKGQDAFNADPIGAGPFMLTEWRRQDRIDLVRNPDYWDSPKPYLDAITLRTVSDASQRLNMLNTGGADLAAESVWPVLDKAENAGFPVATVPAGGGQYLAMNTRRAPFDDVRARRAVALALQPDGINLAAFEGAGQIPTTLFPESSPFHADIPLTTHDPDEAQRLFDELAAEGKPVEFTFLGTSLPDVKMTAETVQAQLSAFDNVEVAVQSLDFAAFIPRNIARDFDMIISSAIVQEPDSTLWNAFHGDSSGNVTGIDDVELDAALDTGRTAGTAEERAAAYTTVQERLVELSPGVWYIRSAPSFMTGKDVHGLQMYALGSLLPEEVWMTP